MRLIKQLKDVPADHRPKSLVLVFKKTGPAPFANGGLLGSLSLLAHSAGAPYSPSLSVCCVDECIIQEPVERVERQGDVSTAKRRRRRSITVGRMHPAKLSLIYIHFPASPSSAMHGWRPDDDNVAIWRNGARYNIDPAPQYSSVLIRTEIGYIIILCCVTHTYIYGLFDA